MLELIFVTANAHKVDEVRQIAGWQLRIVPMRETGFSGTLPETSDTLEGNAIQKAEFLHAQVRKDCFAEDTGLEVDALDGAPGVLSARYAGPTATAKQNVDKLLDALSGNALRTARFRTVIALIMDGVLHTFEGQVEGMIATSPSGSGGFGYDPVFIPQGFDQSFAELSAEIKNTISHRRKAIDAMLKYLGTPSGSP